jgi:hypothetical protein
MKSWKPEVQTDSSGKWYGNALRFATKEEAEANVAALKWNWTLVLDTRVVECEDPVNYRWVDGKLEAIEPPVEPYRFFDYTLRDDMVAALKRYAKDRVPLGDFLEAAVCNDFVEAAGRADEDNQRNLPALAAYLYNEMPRESWGSRAAYKAWLASGNNAAGEVG